MEALMRILSDGEFHDQAHLAAQLKVSPADLARQQEGLQRLGLEIESDTGSGIRLPSALTLLSREKIIGYLPARLHNSFAAIDVHLTIDSTNSAAMRSVQKGLQGRALVTAEQQEQGRGRRGRQWISPIARNIYLTLVWPVGNNVHALEGMSLVTALSLVSALQKSDLLGMEKLRVKWPNDVWLGDSKLAGILLELQRGKEDLHQVIIGMGVNVDMPAKAIHDLNQPVTDLTLQGNLAVDRNKLIANIACQLDYDLEQFMEQGFAGFRDRWQRLDRYHNKSVEVTSGNASSVGTIKGVSATGALILHTAEGEKLITGGELAPSIRSLD